MNGAPGTVGVCGTASYGKPCVPLPGGISVTVGSAAAPGAATAPMARHMVDATVAATMALVIGCQIWLRTAPPPCSGRLVSIRESPLLLSARGHLARNSSVG